MTAYFTISALLIPLAITAYLGRLVDCNMSGCDREGDMDWHISYDVTDQSLNTTQSIIQSACVTATTSDCVGMPCCCGVHLHSCFVDRATFLSPTGTLVGSVITRALLWTDFRGDTVPR